MTLYTHSAHSDMIESIFNGCSDRQECHCASWEDMTLVVMQSINVWHERELQLRFFSHLLATFLLHAEICLRPRMSLGCGVIYLTQEAMIFLCHDTFAWCKLLYTCCETERRVCRLCDLSPRKGTQKQGLPKWWRYHLYILSIPFYTRCSAILFN